MEKSGGGRREKGEKGGGMVKVGTDKKEVWEMVPLSVHFEDLFLRWRETDLINCTRDYLINC